MTRTNRHVDDHLDRDAHESHAFDRRALVAGAAGALVAAALGGSARAAHITSSAGAGSSCGVRSRARKPAPAGARRRDHELGREGPGSGPPLGAHRPRPLDRCGRTRSARPEGRDALRATASGPAAS